MKMRFTHLLSVAAFCTAMTDTESVSIHQKTVVHPNLRRDLLIDATGCDDPSAAVVPAGIYCDFDFILTGFGIDGLPPHANEAHAKHGLNNGASPKGSLYRVTIPEGWDSEIDPVSEVCATISDTYDSGNKGGSGIHFTGPSLQPFHWMGKFLLARPKNQISYAPEFPSLQGGLWLVSGRISFNACKSVDENGRYDCDWILLDYNGKPPTDLCAALGGAGVPGDLLE